MTAQTKVVAEHNLTTFILAIVQLVKDGWELDENNPPGFYGRLHEAHLVHAGEPPERLSRAEILAKARASKKAKAAPEETPEAVEPDEADVAQGE